MRNFRTRGEGERGATAIEYALMVGLVGIGIIASVSSLSTKASKTLKTAGNKTVAQNIRAAGLYTGATKMLQLEATDTGTTDVGSGITRNVPGVRGSGISVNGVAGGYCSTACIIAGIDGDAADDNQDARLGSVSAAIWAKSSAGFTTILRKSDSNNSNGWLLAGLTTPLFQVGYPTVTATTSTSYADGNWHLLVGTLDRQAVTVNLYIDGVLKSSVSAASLAGIDLNANLALRVFPYNYAAMSVDEPMVWNKALSQDEIDLLFQSEKPNG